MQSRRNLLTWFALFFTPTKLTARDYGSPEDKMVVLDGWVLRQGDIARLKNDAA
jgi:hypothetical protein